RADATPGAAADDGIPGVPAQGRPPAGYPPPDRDGRRRPARRHAPGQLLAVGRVGGGADAARAGALPAAAPQPGPPHRRPAVRPARRGALALGAAPVLLL